MKKYLKLWLAALALSFISVGFVSCGGDDDDSASQKVDPKEPEKTVDPVTP